MEKQVLDVNEVCELLQVKVSKAYQIIDQLNKELAEKGFMTVRGKVPRAYICERFFGVKIGVGAGE